MVDQLSIAQLKNQLKKCKDAKTYRSLLATLAGKSGTGKSKRKSGRLGGLARSKKYQHARENKKTTID